MGLDRSVVQFNPASILEHDSFQAEEIRLRANSGIGRRVRQCLPATKLLTSWGI